MALQTAVDENETRFSFQRHAGKLLVNLNETRKNPEHCDAYVSIYGVKISVQRSVLSAASQYLRALFSYDGGLSTHNGKSCINLSIDMETFQSIFDYIYTSEIHLTVKNIQDVLQAADLLLLDDLKVMCCEFLEGCISPHNCISIRDFTAQLSCLWIHRKVTQYLDENVREATYSEDFMRLPAVEVERLMTRDTIQLSCEEDVVDSICRWCRWDTDNRRQHFAPLLSACVRASLLTEDGLGEVYTDSGDSEVAVTVKELVRKKRIQDAGSGVKENHRGMEQVLVVCGGEYSRPSSNGINSSVEEEVQAVTRFVQLHKAPHLSRGLSSVWCDMAPMLTPRSGHGMVEVGGCLYVVGGRNQFCTILNTAEKYDPMTNVWSPIASMEHSRVDFGLVAVDDNIYAIGGSNDMTDPIISLEVYNVITNKWRPLPDMLLKRMWTAFAAANKKIYVIAGGIVGKSYEAVECFDTHTETWNSVSPMRERRIHARAVTVGSDIYVFGGSRQLECPSAVHSGYSSKFCGTEKYDVLNDYWVGLHSHYGAPDLCTMSETSSIWGALYDGEEILVVGELDVGNNQSQFMRAFNRHTGMWHCVVQEKPTRQQHYQCCLLSMPTATLRRLQQQQQHPLHRSKQL